MIPETKSHKRNIASPVTRPAATLQDVHDQKPDLRRLETVLGTSLERIPADIESFDAHVPTDGFHRARAYWSSVQAYERWRNILRRKIRQHSAGCRISNLPNSPPRVRELSATSTQYNPSIPLTKMLGHTDVERVRAKSD